MVKQDNQRQGKTSPETLYDPQFEHDACGVGFVTTLKGKPSHDIVQLGLRAAANLDHRGAVAADGLSGDGAGILTQIPQRLFADYIQTTYGTQVAAPEDIAAAMVFFPRDDVPAQATCRAIIENTIKRYEIPLHGWRTVPVDSASLGEHAARTEPVIEQALLSRPEKLNPADFERTLYLIRKEIEERVASQAISHFYIPSFSSRIIVYKGLMLSSHLADYYRDLRDPAYESVLVLFHQRYSTNTFPNWSLAQPFRTLAHNGEINTLQGNRNWMRAREAELASPIWGEQVKLLSPVITRGGSDSASLDNVIEALELGGRDLLHCLMMVVPEAWENNPQMPDELRAFYEYHSCLMESWDGPAALAFTDGKIIGASLDRNGLRPSRYAITSDGLVVFASEAGVLELDEARIVEKGRLGPGKMMAIDTVGGKILRNDEIKEAIASRQPYREWLTAQMVKLDCITPVELPLEGRYRPLPPAGPPGERSNGTGNGTHTPSESSTPAPLSLTQCQLVFGYTHEEIELVLKPMAKEGKENVWSMGDDAPLAIFSRKGRPLSSYFKQRFAQVTNPPIDPLRERLVMSLGAYLGREGNLLAETPEHAHLISISSPILLEQDYARLLSTDEHGFPLTILPALWKLGLGGAGLEDALLDLCMAADEAVKDGATLLILSDRGIDKDHLPIPMLLAVGAVHQYLIHTGQRMRTGLVVDTGECWEVHQYALLIGYGVGAIYPYTALETMRQIATQRGFEGTLPQELIERYRHAIEEGLLKIISKMGISTLSSYRGGQIFEAIGLNREVIESCFHGTPSRLGGIGFEEIAVDVEERHRAAFAEKLPARLPDPGTYRFRRDEEYHAFNPQVVKALQKASLSNDDSDYRIYSDMVTSRPPLALRDLLVFKTGQPIPLEEVEPVETIRRRFVSTAMSIGALSPEAHQTLTLAMNMIGGKSNTGEGGEDTSWFYGKKNGIAMNSKIKQVASARFGVTAEYLANAEELEIKMAQGSKPGEGGQLPAHKVTGFIAKLRHTITGIPLISPPPHHDIYSIEDLAQLIYDLKQVNPRARVGVKLVAEAGVGTIAAGVAKAYADYVLISGHDGGTGASPLSSIKNAGIPWELGLAETQQVLVLNDLRSRVTLRTDGGLKTGRDIVIAALLGAEEYGLGTSMVVAIGCDMARQCHLNTCPTGIATQREDLRVKFTGRPEMVVAFLSHLAQEVRLILAQLGYRNLDDIIGHTELLEQREMTDGTRESKLDLNSILTSVNSSPTQALRSQQLRNDRPSSPGLDEEIISAALPALEHRQPVAVSFPVVNRNRTVGTRLAGEIAYRLRGERLPDDLIQLRFNGSAGQSFGAFCTHGMRLELTGEANDYVGKGMSGGIISVRPPEQARFLAHEATIVGNTVLYGATGGSLYVAGRAGERFGVRNSGATTVVEGVGDHCCEYMTGGLVAVLGSTGRNFGAGMSAGTAYVLDEADTFRFSYNSELIDLQRLEGASDEAELQSLLRKHLDYTASARASTILENWQHYAPLFWKVLPRGAAAVSVVPAKADDTSSVLAR